MPFLEEGGRGRALSERHANLILPPNETAYNRRNFIRCDWKVCRYSAISGNKNAPPNVFVTEIENLNSMYPPGCIALNCDPLLCLLSHLTIPETITLLIVEQTILKFKKS